MLPKAHILLGAIFTFVILLIIPNINIFYLGLIFLSSFLIDFDHYVASVLHSKKLIGLKESFEYHDKKDMKGYIEYNKGIKKKGDFHLFHTIEFHALVGVLGLVWIGFFYIFIGMVFHSLIDVMSLIYADRMYRREFFFFKWISERV